MRTVFVWLGFLWALAGCSAPSVESKEAADPTVASSKLDPERRYIKSFSKDQKRLSSRSVRERYNLTPEQERALKRKLERKEPPPDNR